MMQKHAEELPRVETTGRMMQEQASDKWSK